MSIQDDTGVESTGTTDETATDEPAVAPRLALATGIFGVDAEGYDHRYSRARDEIYRTRGDRVERVVDMTGQSIATYIEFVASEVGWVDQWYFETGTMGVEGDRRLAAARKQARAEGER